MTTNLKLLARAAPSAELSIRSQLLSEICGSEVAQTFNAIMATMDTTLLPEKPESMKWGSNPFEPRVIVMDVLAKLISEGVVAEVFETDGIKYALRLGGGEYGFRI